MRGNGVKMDGPFVGCFARFALILDSWMVGRLARELDHRLAGARVQAFRGRGLDVTLVCYRRGTTQTLRAWLAPESPLLAVTESARSGGDEAEAGWTAGVALLLRNCTIDAVLNVANDRIVALDLRSRSAFGVPSRHRIVLELQPRRANALVLAPSGTGEWTVLAAAKQIHGGAGTRSVVAGEAYVSLPVARQRFKPDQIADLINAVEPSETRTVSRLLSDFDSACTPVLARECLHRAPKLGGDSLATRLLQAWADLRPRVAAAASDLSSPIYVYRTEDQNVCHCISLTWPHAKPTLLPDVNGLCAAEMAAASDPINAPAVKAARERLRVQLDRCRSELESLRQKESAASQADDLRRAGDAIYANLNSITPGSDSFVSFDGRNVALDPALDPKENARSYFWRFKKARSGLPQIAARLQALRENKAYWEQLSWELERLPEMSSSQARQALAEVLQAMRLPLRPNAAPSTKAQAPTNRALEVDGAAIYVGRSPIDNDRLTFRVAKPDDYWFHARGIPGAHVVLKLRDGRAVPTDAQLVAAAELAAGHSRAWGANKVEVDYARRKYVRRRAAGRPGLVWYSHFSTLSVAPRKEGRAQSND
ncbi:MAG: NFACT RNA binding domain-containing protein [Candidatus Eremiobacteraeota bacterium]|nr:NFACT RNA binding domain-containing protein [Candidatus Eremiobacteraeota bacterium]